MRRLNRFILILFLLHLFINLKAQCPDARGTIVNKDIHALKALSDKLKTCGDHKDTLALAYHTLGTVYYRLNLDSAILFTQKALDIRKALFQKNPNVDLGRSYHNLGFFYARQNRPRLAKPVLKKAIEIYTQLDTNKVINSYLVLANVYSNEGEYKLAEDYYKLMILEAEKADRVTQVIDGLYTLGNLLNEKKDFEAAKEHLERAGVLLEKNDYPNRAAGCFLNLGIAHYHLGHFPTSIGYYRKAILKYHELEDCEMITKSFNGIGRAYQKNNETVAADQALQKGLKMALDCGYPDLIGLSYDNIGESYLEKKLSLKALAAYQNAIKTLMPFFRPEDDFENPKQGDLKNVSNKIDLLVYLSDKARALKQLSDRGKDSVYLIKTLELYLLADQLIDQVRREHTDEGTKLFWREQVLPIYEQAISTCHELKDTESAYFFFEKSRAILLLEALQSSDALVGIPDSIRELTLKLKQKLLTARENLEDAKEAERTDQLRHLVDVQRAYDDHFQRLSQLNPTYYKVKYETGAIALSEFREQMIHADDQASVHYFYGIKNIYAQVITRHSVNLINLGPTEPIEADIRRLLIYFERSSAIENAPKDFLEQAEKVYRALIQPLNLAQTKGLLIFPDGALAYLPFEALVRSSKGDISSAHYMIKDHMIRYGYSATILSQHQQGNRADVLSIAAFAPFAGQSSEQYPKLSFSNDELSLIREKVNGVYLKDNDASKYQFIAYKNQHQILHLSTHAYASMETSRPHVVFADTVLFLSELYALNIPAELVVLSACQTNIGKLSPGEGVMSLGRGFTYAGARSFVSSLWNVNASSSSGILSSFYDQLNKGFLKHEALHQAKIEYLENENVLSYERSPYYWAGLVFYGDESAVTLEPAKRNPYLLFGFAFVILGGVVFLMVRRRNNN